MAKFIIKHSQGKSPQLKRVTKTNSNKTDTTMDINEKITAAESVLCDTPARPVKRVKKDKGLIERTESSTIVLTEDNKQLLND
jgi:hypothetical protein